MPKITINGNEYEVEAGKTVLQAALENGIYIPHYCYHPYLPISGNCRMCLVDIKPGPPKLSIACSTRVQDGMEVNTETEKVQAARKAVMEFLLKNHPIDCPVCDQAGECWLQNYYMDYGLYSARVEAGQKVKKKKAQRMGDKLVLDSERCILCTRCVRFMKEVAGDDCLIIANRRDQSEITPFPGKTLDNPYSLCLADVCPVGAWTSADFRFKKRTWFLSESPSVCPSCAKGCNIWIDHHQGAVARFRPRINDDINNCWLCDRGRLSYKAVNDGRLLAPAVQKEGGGSEEPGWDGAIAKAAELLKKAEGKLTVALSASLAVEEGKRALALFKDGLKAKVVIHGGEPGEEDDFLRRADQNANTKGLNELEIKEALGSELPEDGVLVVVESLPIHGLPEGLPDPAVVLSPSASGAAKTAAVALPAQSFAERGGTFVNADGIRQSFEAAIEPVGDSLPSEEIVGRLAKALGVNV